MAKRYNMDSIPLQQNLKARLDKRMKNRMIITMTKNYLNQKVISAILTMMSFSKKTANNIGEGANIVNDTTNE